MRNKITESEPPVDWNFYQMFWGLQAYFLDPVKAFDAWEQVTAQLNAVLNVFKQYPISEEVPYTSGNNTQKARQFVDHISPPRLFAVHALPCFCALFQEANAAKYSFTSASTDCYLTKYLTSSRLLRLQLRDPWFRRHIMVQFLIFFQSLRFVSESPAIPHHKLKEQQVRPPVMGQSEQALSFPFCSLTYLLRRKMRSPFSQRRPRLLSGRHRPTECTSPTPSMLFSNVKITG